MSRIICYRNIKINTVLLFFAFLPFVDGFDDEVKAVFKQHFVTEGRGIKKIMPFAPTDLFAFMQSTETFQSSHPSCLHPEETTCTTQ
ncbi:uncharacterized protein BYT42DRAFT_563235 [Radiomyces spectabilis]|uniref:uncharacterized protein n=1 Tax=Radiomyces spectabilis TaxID=64574 RepID=UPI002220DB1B|nr:uncharacterized protein BYT42DRAFT_563235 [Radiomyces spectabilis]KAI8384661.1 hypothetical protein BYT42DRAFT_563235 [Radiomyces spectabilis]